VNKFFTIAKNTFTETIRQPVYAVIIITALLLLFLSPSITMYTMEDDNKLLRELGLSTLFLVGLFISIFSASASVAEEIENKTIQTVLSKPVRRPIFIIAKFFGVICAVALAHYICTIGVLMAIRHGVLESAGDTHDCTVIVAAAVSIVFVFLLSAFFNYSYDWKFTSTAVILLAVFATLSITFLFFIDRNWKFNPADNKINQLDVYGSVLLLLAAIIISAIAVAFSTRFNVAVILSFCIGIFLLGLVTDYVFGRLAPGSLWARFFYYVIPNLQVFWIADGIYEGSRVSLNYVLMVAGYTTCYTVAVLSLATALFQRRQVG
jgi:ABC-type transport system involved in multi-copper enzyme maturation permease subunit